MVRVNESRILSLLSNTRLNHSRFASVDNFREAAMSAIDTVKWTPDFGKNRISAMTASRSDWCISRQRTWGVPIPVFYHKETGEVLMSEESIGHVRSVVEKQGSDAWWELSVAELLPPSMQHLADFYEKGKDTMDVWFDSGTSWAGVLNKKKGLAFPADMYLEGSDQHRGWFQSSLLTAVATTGIDSIFNFHRQHNDPCAMNHQGGLHLRMFLRTDSFSTKRERK